MQMYMHMYVALFAQQQTQFWKATAFSELILWHYWRTTANINHSEKVVVKKDLKYSCDKKYIYISNFFLHC